MYVIEMDSVVFAKIITIFKVIIIYLHKKLKKLKKHYNKQKKNVLNNVNKDILVKITI